MDLIQAVKLYVIKMTEDCGPGMKVLLMDKSTVSIFYKKTRDFSLSSFYLIYGQKKTGFYTLRINAFPVNLPIEAYGNMLIKNRFVVNILYTKTSVRIIFTLHSNI